MKTFKTGKLLLQFLIFFLIIGCDNSLSNDDDGTTVSIIFEITDSINQDSEINSFSIQSDNLKSYEATKEYSGSSNIVEVVYRFTYKKGENITINISSNGYKDIPYTITNSELTMFSFNRISIGMFKSTCFTTKVSGYTYLRNSNLVIPESKVFLYSLNGEANYKVNYISVISGPDGYYELEVPHFGEFELAYDIGNETIERQSFITTGTHLVHDAFLAPNQGKWLEVIGRVRNVDDSTAIENATVKSGVFIKTTDSQGAYREIYLEKGTTHTITVSATGFVTKTFTIDPDNDSSSTIIDVNLAPDN